MHYHYIVIGQGIAGTLLAWQLHKQNKRVLIIDKFSATSSSQVAAGIYLPVTGRRIVKSWMSDALIPFAENTYSELEQITSKQFLNILPVLEIFDSIKTANEWQQRAGQKDIAPFIKTFHSKDFLPALHCNFGAVELQQTGYVNMPVFLEAMRHYFLQHHMLLQEEFDFSQLKIESTVAYKNTIAGKIIFCEGVALMHNPFFNHLPYQFSKGEIITIECTSLPQHSIINSGIFILPVGGHRFKVGSTYEWNNLNTEVTDNALHKLTTAFKKVVSAPFKVIGHQASIRPTVKERRPFVGLHAQHPQVGIFNGLGTKGVMLAPYFSQHFADHLTLGTGLMPEIDINRFN